MKTKFSSINKKLDPINTDIFENIKVLNETFCSTNIFIPNTCGPSNDIISGFSKELFKRFPVCEISLQVSSNRKPGRVNFIDVLINKKTKSKIIVGNMCCLNNHIKSKRSIHYGQLVFCMYEVKQKLLELQKQNSDFVTEIHCPKFGSGIAGGNWNFISELITDIWGDFKVSVYNHLVEKDNHV